MMKAVLLMCSLAMASCCGGPEEADKAQSKLTESRVLAIVEPLFKDRFSHSYEANKPYVATLRDGTWHVRGTLPHNGPGGTAEAQVRHSDGKVLKVFHTQ